MTEYTGLPRECYEHQRIVEKIELRFRDKTITIPRERINIQGFRKERNYRYLFQAFVPLSRETYPSDLKILQDREIEMTVAITGAIHVKCARRDRIATHTVEIDQPAVLEMRTLDRSDVTSDFIWSYVDGVFQEVRADVTPGRDVLRGTGRTHWQLENLKPGQTFCTIPGLEKATEEFMTEVLNKHGYKVRAVSRKKFQEMVNNADDNLVLSYDLYACYKT